MLRACRHNGNRLFGVQPNCTKYAYDAAGRITVLRNPQDLRTSYGYDAADRRLVTRQGNGTRASVTYDADDRITRLANLNPAMSVLSSFDYSYDNTVNRTRVIEAGGPVVTYSYDATYQLTRERRSGANAYDLTHVWDAAGNRAVKIDGGTRTTGSYDEANQLRWLQTGASRVTFAFDANGNQTLEMSAPTTRTTNVWDYENRMTVALQSATNRLTNTYDGDNLRVAKDDGSGAVKFVWDGQLYLAETDNANATQVVYTQEPSAYGSALSQRRGATVRHYHADALGSVFGLTDAAAGATDSYLYKAFGEALAASGSTLNPFRYVGLPGYYFDAEALGFHVRRRRYLPSLSRWSSNDSWPELRIHGASLFLYVNNGPLGHSDPSGLQLGAAKCPISLGVITTNDAFMHDTLSGKHRNPFRQFARGIGVAVHFVPNAPGAYKPGSRTWNGDTYHWLQVVEMDFPYDWGQVFYDINPKKISPPFYDVALGFWGTKPSPARIPPWAGVDGNGESLVSLYDEPSFPFTHPESSVSAYFKNKGFKKGQVVSWTADACLVCTSPKKTRHTILGCVRYGYYWTWFDNPLVYVGWLITGVAPKCVPTGSVDRAKLRKASNNTKQPLDAPYRYLIEYIVDGD